MIVSAHRPYFAPYPGFFKKIILSDVFVVMDSVQFPLGRSWLTRNRLKNDKGTYWIRIPVWKTGRGLQRINEVEICYERNWKDKLIKGLKMAYKNAPYFSEIFLVWEDILEKEPGRLLELNLALIKYVLDYLQINTRVVLLSELGISAKEPELTIAICKKLNADKFLAQKSAQKYLSAELFKKEGIEPVFFDPNPCIYPQLWGEFIPNLSIFDLLFNCGPKSAEIIEKKV